MAGAILLWMARTADQAAFDVGFRGAGLELDLAGLEPWFEPAPPLRLSLDLDASASDCLDRIGSDIAAHEGRGTYLRDVVRRYPELRGLGEGELSAQLGVLVTIGESSLAGDDEAAVVVKVSADGESCLWDVDPARLSAPLGVLQQRCQAFLHEVMVDPHRAASRISMVTTEERQRLLVDCESAGAEPRVDNAGRAVRCAGIADA